MTALFGESIVRAEPVDPVHLETARHLSSLMLECADTQGAGTLLDGYPGGSPAAESVQLGIMQDYCLSAGFASHVVELASDLTTQHWQARRKQYE